MRKLVKYDMECVLECVMSDWCDPNKDSMIVGVNILIEEENSWPYSFETRYS